MRDSRHETLLERPEAESAGRRRLRDAKSRGRADLRRVGSDHKALPEAAPAQTGDVEPKPVPGPPARKGAALEATLPAQVRANPDLTLAEHCELFEESAGVRVSTATISRAFKRLGLPLKKVPPGLRARRSRKGELARRNREVGPAPSGVRGRVWDAHLHDSSAGTGSQGREGLR